MGLTKQKLGRYIERVEHRNSALKYGIDDVRGVTLSKEIKPTKADVSGRSFNRFQIVKPRDFILNRRTHGIKIGLGFNNTDQTFIVTEDYVVFRSANEAVLMPEYLDMFIKRPEFDRYANFDAWGSATVFFNWEEICDVPIIVPPQTVQQKYVDVYNAMLTNQSHYESGLEDLKLTCDAYLDELRRDLPHTAIGDYLELCEERNDGLIYGVDSVKGVSIEKRFIETKADMLGVSLKPYYLVEPNSFAYVTVTSRNGEKISLAHNGSDDTYICSSSYVVFRVRKNDKLIPSYLLIFFSRSEFDRYTRFHSWGSARETFGWEDMKEVTIPIPDISVQKSIVDLYQAYLMRREINEKMKVQIKDLCPILIKGSIEEPSA